MLKKPKNGVEGLIEWWTKLDDVVHLMRNRKAVRLWEWKGIPHNAVKTPQGEWCGACIQFTAVGGTKRHLCYNDIMVNRYWYKDFFERDDYRRISAVFKEVVSMEN